MPSTYANLLNSVGLVADQTAMSNADATATVLLSGSRQAEQCVGDLHGKHYHANYRGKMFGASVVASTMPVIANNLVSVFSLINPPSSGVNMEMVETTVSQNLAAVFVDVVGWYYSPVTKLFGGTFTTPGTPQSENVASSPPNKGLFYSAYTHSGTPTLVDVVGSFGATSNVSALTVNKFYDGRLLLAPGNVMSLALSTTSTGTFLAMNMWATWTEWPV